MDSKKIYLDAIALYGSNEQLAMAQEEATELALAVRKYIRNPSAFTLDQLAGEIADVEIMIAQLEIIEPELKIKIYDKKNFKLRRLEYRIKYHKE